MEAIKQKLRITDATMTTEDRAVSLNVTTYWLPATCMSSLTKSTERNSQRKCQVHINGYAAYRN